MRVHDCPSCSCVLPAPVGRCAAVFDGYRCVDPEEPKHKYHSPSLFTEAEEARMEPWTAPRKRNRSSQFDQENRVGF